MVGRLSKIFYKVSYILSIVFIALIAITAILLGAILGAAIANETIDPNDTVLAISMLISFELSFVSSLVLCILNLVMTKRASNNPTKQNHITAIVFGALSGVYFGVAAGILGLVDLKNQPKTEEKPEAVDVKPAE